MNHKIFDKEVREFIDQNINSDINKIILKGSPFTGVSTQEIVAQINGKKKAAKKIPLWLQTEAIYFPPKLNLEQTSSMQTATYKSELISGENIIDLTGGFGIDSYYFAQKFNKVVHCELNESLAKIAHYNFEKLGQKNIETIVGDSLETLKNTEEKFDWIFVDPSRRDNVKGKVFLLNDCLPNVPENLDLLFEKSELILLKNSPILDITSSINELKFVKEIHVVAVENEVKELLFVLKKNYTARINIVAVNIQKEEKTVFEFSAQDNTHATYGFPETYLYEPNAAILKSGGFYAVSKKFGLNKLHQHTHLYTSVERFENFPGRVFKINQISKYDKKTLAKIIPSKKANITTRNFPDSVANIRKKTKIKDGGTNYLFFTTDLNDKKIVLLCDKL